MKPSHADHLEGHIQDPLLPLRLKKKQEVEGEVWEVEELRSWQRNAEEGGRLEYEVKWRRFEELT